MEEPIGERVALGNAVAVDLGQYSSSVSNGGLSACVTVTFDSGAGEGGVNRSENPEKKPERSHAGNEAEGNTASLPDDGGRQTCRDEPWDVAREVGEGITPEHDRK